MKTILCYGDSNTYGLKSDLLTRYPRDKRWTGILQKRLGEEFYVIEEGLGAEQLCGMIRWRSIKTEKNISCPVLTVTSPWIW